MKVQNIKTFHSAGSLYGNGLRLEDRIEAVRHETSISQVIYQTSRHVIHKEIAFLRYIEGC